LLDFWSISLFTKGCFTLSVGVRLADARPSHKTPPTMFICKGPPSLHSRSSHLVLFLVIIALVFHTIRLANQRQIHTPLLRDAEIIPEGNASPEELYLSRLARECGLSKDMSWMAWRIMPSAQSEEWPSVTEVNLKFKSVAPKMINLDEPDRRDLYAKKRMELPVPASPLLGQVDASDFLFGVSTTYARLVDRDYAMIKAWARWLTDGRQHSNGASLVLVLDQARSDQLEEVDQTLQASGIDCWVTTTEEPMSMARRYFELSRILKTFAANLAANGQDKRWFGLVEDDVFFPSLSYLRDRLFTYNTDGQHYIGLPSERLDWEEDGTMFKTYGGGALLLTRAAISRVPNLPCFETSFPSSPSGGISSFRSKRWDELIHDCMMRHSDLDMHVLPGFFSPNDDTYDPQIDSYETGQQPLLLRRYAERHLLNINKAHLVTNVCGESCFMQRYLFRDNWVLVNGISITEYPDGIEIQRQAPTPPEPKPAAEPVPETKPKDEAQPEKKAAPEAEKGKLRKRSEPEPESEAAPKDETETEDEPLILLDDKPGPDDASAAKQHLDSDESFEGEEIRKSDGQDDDSTTSEKDNSNDDESKPAGEAQKEDVEEKTKSSGEEVEALETLEEEEGEHIVPSLQQPLLPPRVAIDDASAMAEKAKLAWTGRKNVWRLADSAISKDGTVWQAYVKKAKKTNVPLEEKQPEETDSVIVLIWEHGKSVA